MMSNQLNLNAEIVLEDQGDSHHNLWDLVDLYERKLLIPPLHQRDAQSWDKQKRNEWVRRMKNKALKPVGVIVTYQLNDGAPSAIFLNDGLQRISTTSEYKNNPFLYGDTLDFSEQIIRSILMPRQHRYYNSHENALRDFQRLNFGTPLTPFEYFAGILRYISNYESDWKPLLDQVHETMLTQSMRLISERRGGKSKYHKYLRSDYGLFYRFISEDKAVTPYKTATQTVKLDQILNETSIEARLKIQLEKTGLKETKRQLNMFKRMVERETSAIETFWTEVADNASKKKGVLPNLYRHLIDVAIWKRNTKITTKVWCDYIKGVLKNTQGAASLINPDSPRDRIPLSLNDLHRLKGTCRLIGSSLYKEGLEKKKTNKRNGIKPGYDISHKLPFGESDETIIEPGGINRARGASPITRENEL